MNLEFNLSLLDPLFLIAMAAMVAARAVTPRSWQTTVGLLATLVILGIASMPTLLALAGSTVLVVYPFSQWIVRLKPTNPGAAKWVLGSGVVLVIAFWLFVKLNRDLQLPFVHGTSLGSELLQVIGFSYFIFKGINVLWMHYLMGAVPNATFIRTLAFATFLPTLTSGPIQKFADFCREAATPQPLSFPLICTAVERITRGYFYKICIAVAIDLGANQLLTIAEPNAYQSILTIAALYLFFFFDFCGYSHIAIGLGLLMGIRVPENFRQPFLATSVTEFWRNWHITIGDWFRDHVFIPMGGMRLGGLRAAMFAAAIMLICGLWHGFTPVFMAWGVWHASMLFLEGVLGSKPMPPAARHGPRYWLRIAFTNARIAFGAIFFLPTFEAISPLLRGFLRWW